MRLLPVLLLVAALALISPAHAQPRDEAPEASPAGPTSTSVAEELTSKTTEQPLAEEKPAVEEEQKPVKKPEPEKKKKPAPKPEKKPAKKAEPVKKEAVKEEPPAKKAEAPKPAPAISSGKDPVIVINPCTGEVSEEAAAPEAKTLSIQPGKQKSCLTARQCDALCRVGESFGEGGGAPYLSPRGYIVFGMDAFTSFEACIETCGPKCK
ncbi:MAG: hypothetical protein ACAH80_11995 [Alphaproteobacteria bacterium]